jgi:hypothetical protein
MNYSIIKILRCRHFVSGQNFEGIFDFFRPAQQAAKRIFNTKSRSEHQDHEDKKK